MTRIIWSLLSPFIFIYAVWLLATQDLDFFGGES